MEGYQGSIRASHQSEPSTRRSLRISRVRERGETMQPHPVSQEPFGQVHPSSDSLSTDHALHQRRRAEAVMHNARLESEAGPIGSYLSSEQRRTLKQPTPYPLSPPQTSVQTHLHSTPSQPWTQQKQTSTARDNKLERHYIDQPNKSRLSHSSPSASLGRLAAICS